jgi:hypothetical protein
MSFCRLLTAVGVLVVLSGFSSMADADGGAGKKKIHTARGLVVDAATDGSSITIKVHPHKKNVPAPATRPPAVDKKFRLDKETKIVFVSGKKGKREFTPATFADVHKGEHVNVVLRAGQSDLADRIAIIKHKKKLF